MRRWRLNAKRGRGGCRIDIDRCGNGVVGPLLLDVVHESRSGAGVDPLDERDTRVAAEEMRGG